MTDVIYPGPAVPAADADEPNAFARLGVTLKPGVNTVDAHAAAVLLAGGTVTAVEMTPTTTAATTTNNTWVPTFSEE